MAREHNGGATIGHEAQLWAMADALRGSMDAAEYKHVCLGLLFLKSISDAFEEQHDRLLAEKAQGADPEDPDEYRAKSIFWVPPEARWPHLKAQARQATIGQLVDRTHRELTDKDIARIATTFHAWPGEPSSPSPRVLGKGGERSEPGEGSYTDISGFCTSAPIEEIRTHGHVLTPGRYVGAEAQEDDGEPFDEKMKRLVAQPHEQQVEAAKLDAAIEANLEALGHDL